jgi:hypothetical protein
MDEPIYEDAFVLRVDDDGERELTGFVGGPAGVSELQLDESTYLSVDTADPFTLASLRCTRATHFGLLLSLFGKEVANRLLVEPPGAAAVRVGRRREDPTRRSSLPGGGPEAYELGGAVSLAGLASDPTRHELIRGTAALELAGQAAFLPLPDHVREQLVDTWVARGADLVASGTDVLPDLSTAGGAMIVRLDDVLESAARGISNVVPIRVLRALADVREVIEDLRGGGSEMSEIVSAGLPPATPAGPEELEPLLIDLRPAGRLVVHRAKAENVDGGWVRVLAAGSSTLIAIAPFEDAGQRWRADLIVPPDLGLGHLQVDVTDDPLPARSKLEATRRAIRLGRAAVAYEVVHHRRTAEAWRRCAEAWRELGDPRRATLAERRASRPQPGRRAFLADEMHVALAR